MLNLTLDPNSGSNGLQLRTLRNARLRYEMHLWVPHVALEIPANWHHDRLGGIVFRRHGIYPVRPYENELKSGKKTEQVNLICLVDHFRLLFSPSTFGAMNQMIQVYSSHLTRQNFTNWNTWAPMREAPALQAILTIPTMTFLYFPIYPNLTFSPVFLQTCSTYPNLKVLIC